MPLTGLPVVGGSVVLALVLVGLVPATWDRWTHARAAGRTTLVLLATVGTLLAVAVVVNASAGFYPTLGSIVSSRNAVALGAGGLRVALPDGGGGEVSDLTDLAAAHRSGSGVLTRVDLGGPVSGIRRTAAVYLPDAYFDPGWQSVRFPVVELLSGSPGSPSQLLQQLDVGRTLDLLIGRHNLAPTVVVLPDTNGSPVRDRECVDSAAGVRDDTYLSTDVPDAVARRFRVDPPGRGWALMGLSTGGYCAVNLALRHPDRYAAAASLSGYYRPLTDPTTGPLFARSPALREQNDPSWRITHLPVPALDLWLSAGTGEVTALRDMRAFAALTRPPLRVRTLEVRGGGHNFPSWKAVLGPALVAVTAALPPPQAPLPVAARPVPAPG